MRVHLIIQRHGLPVTRILWTTSPPSIYGQTTPSSSVVPAASCIIAPTRTPNAMYSTGGYTIAQLLEDVNEVVPLETEPAIFDRESSGQWGLEDYVVEVGGSECLHFMEVDGLLRDGDEVVIRALQIADLRARRLSGRHQISTDGKHLIDGVPFGRPFLKRQLSSRPAIAIPPRKKRRTIFAAWDNDAGYGEEETQWTFPGRVSSMKELSRLKDQEDNVMADEFTDYHDDDYEDYEDYHDNHDDSGVGTVIRHPLSEEEDDEASESDEEELEIDAEDLAEELEALEKDQKSAGLSPVEKPDQEQTEPGGYPLRTRTSILRAISGSQRPRALVKSPSEANPLRRDSKAVRFKKAQKQASPCPSQAEDPHLNKAEQASEDSISIYKSFSSSSESESDITTSDSDDEDSTSPSEESSSDSESSSDESESEAEAEAEDESEDDESTSESDDESISSPAPEVKLRPKFNAPGQGSLKTKKSNRRSKMRRRLSKLKDLGALPPEADFASLREWEAANGGWYEPPGNMQGGKRLTKDQEQEEFEAKRQKLLRDLASGGIDVDEFTEKENVPPEAETDGVSEERTEDITESAKRRTLDVASSRRLLFGSLSVRTPRSKEDEEATRKKLAGKVKNLQPIRLEEQAPEEETDGDSEVDWQGKLVLKATECVFDDIELSSPPFPFEQRWDAEAHQIIGKRKGWGRKRKRRQQLQVYDADGYEDYENGYEGYANEDLELDRQLDFQLNYDDVQPGNGPLNEAELPAEEAHENEQDDLPPLPEDLSTVPELSVDNLKQGSVIAFKQLVLSKATNWQPTVSDYLVARIDDVFEDNVLKLRLAKRDWRQAEHADLDENDDEEEGPRKYDGFEMPGMDVDEAEDDGFREISFADLFDAKLIQAVDLADVGGVDKASNSFVDRGASLRNSNPTATEDETMRDVEAVEENPRHSSPEPADVQALEEDLQALAREIVEEEIPEESRAANAEGHVSPVVQSPRFVGFHSRAETPSLPDAPQRQAPDAQSTASPKAADDADGADPLPETAEALSTPRSTVPPNAFSVTPRLLGSDDELQMLSSPENLINFNRVLEQLFRGKRPTSGSPVPKKEPGLSQKRSRSHTRSRSRSRSSSYVPNPFYEVDKAQEELLRGSKNAKNNTVGPKDDSQMSSPPSHRTPTSAQPQRSPTPQDHSLISSIEESNWLSRHDEVFGTQPPKASQFSNIVDLTQSSPPVSAGESDEDSTTSHRLPRGPGWVQKNMPRSRFLSAGRRIQTLNERSISPPSQKWKRDG